MPPAARFLLKPQLRELRVQAQLIHPSDRPSKSLSELSAFKGNHCVRKKPSTFKKHSPFTIVFPSNKVHSRRLPLARMGRIFLAHSLSCSSPPSAKISRETISKLMRPRVSPLKRPDKSKRQHANSMLRLVSGEDELVDDSMIAHPALLEQLQWLK